MSVLNPTVPYIDPFEPTLKSSPVLAVSAEQRYLIREILDVACSDSRFAEKAYAAISFILTSGSPVPPVLTSLQPSQATIGQPSFTLHVFGTGFKNTDVINWNGGDEPTVFVSSTELTTQVDMTTATTPTTIPVKVGQSNIMTFSLIAVTSRVASKSSESKVDDLKKDLKEK